MIELLQHAVDVVLHLDKYLAGIIQAYGVWTYLLLFLIVFCETGLVVTPFLPGDSLLFAVGAFAAAGALDLWLTSALLLVAAVAGRRGELLDRRTGRPGGVPTRRRRGCSTASTWSAPTSSTRSYGGKTIILARFVPIVRTFAPFVAGIGRMTYAQFALYNVTGGRPVDRRPGLRRLLLRQHPDRPPQLQPRRARDHRAVDPAGRDRRLAPAPPRPPLVPIAAPSLRGSAPPARTPVSGSTVIPCAWPTRPFHASHRSMR